MTGDQCFVKRADFRHTAGRNSTTLPKELAGVVADIVERSEPAARHEIGVIVNREEMQ
jgi:hypothetical protein